MTAHDDDPFEYGDDGMPVGVKAPAVQPTLTGGELHDVVVAASAANEFESIALIDVLDQAGIPAMKRGGIIHLGSAGPCEVLVPRKLLDAARIEIERFRAAATKRGVEEAFNPENVEDQWNDPKCDDVTSEMLGLASIPIDDRKARLADYVVEWMAEGRQLTEIAQHLAAAGLERADADAIIEYVKSQRIDLIREKLEERATAGYVIGFCGILAFLAAIYVIAVAHQGFIYLGLACFGTVAGFGLAAQAKSKLRALDDA